MKKISIITPSYNRVGLVETAIQSVLDQNYPEFEHIIIDGGSTDGTLDVLKNYHHLRIICEPDLGMYDALNKGIALVTGEIVAFLNTDDHYAKGAFQTALNHFTDDSAADVVWGCADIFEMTSKGEITTEVLQSPKNNEEIIPFLVMVMPIFNACFFRKQVFERWGQFMAHLKIAGDREFMIRVALGGCKFHLSDAILYHYLTHDESMTYGIDPDTFEQWNKEHCQIAEYYLEHPTIQGNARHVYRQLHTISNLSLIKIACKRGELGDAIGIALHGWRINPKWPIMFLSRSMKVLSNMPHGGNSDGSLDG